MWLPVKDMVVGNRAVLGKKIKKTLRSLSVRVERHRDKEGADRGGTEVEQSLLSFLGASDLQICSAGALMRDFDGKAGG